jgi:hypothetical protein
MALIDLWKSSHLELAGKNLKQIIAIAGEGRLSDDSICSQELRDLLSYLPSDKLQSYCAFCLEEKFDDGGFALQDIINQVGSRLGFTVQYGRYRGVSNQIGYDGIWVDDDGHSLIVEVKTTDAYRINLDKILDYRKRLGEQGRLTVDQSSVLIVVGRQDTGDLEAQIRGSKHNWDVRLISADALLRLMLVKEETDDSKIRSRIAQILRPREFTRLDSVVDLIFSTTEDIQSYQSDEIDEEAPSLAPSNKADEPASFHSDCISIASSHLGIDLFKKSRSIYSSKNGKLLVSCSVSKEYVSENHFGYWYAFHPSQREALESCPDSYVVLGSGSAERVFIFPFPEFQKFLPGMNQTTRSNGKHYWHVHINNYDGRYYLLQRKGIDKIDITKWLLEGVTSKM